MRLLRRLFQIISEVLPPGLSEKEAQQLSRLNPEKFYVENVRSLLNVSYSSAARICETAVRQGLFERRVEVKCPDGAVSASAENEAALPPTVRCWTLEEGQYTPVELPTRDLEKVTFYRINEKTDSFPVRQTA
jgi:hypothetical protein